MSRLKRLTSSTQLGKRLATPAPGKRSEATRKFSLHTTGYAFDILRRYRTRSQARAFQFMLDRLTALDLIAWAAEPDAIHVTVSSDAKVLLPLLAKVK